MLYFAGKFSRGGAQVWEHVVQSYKFVFENTPKKLILKSLFPPMVEAILLSSSKKSAAGA